MGRARRGRAPFPGDSPSRGVGPSKGPIIRPRIHGPGPSSSRGGSPIAGSIPEIAAASGFRRSDGWNKRWTAARAPNSTAAAVEFGAEAEGGAVRLHNRRLGGVGSSGGPFVDSGALQRPGCCGCVQAWRVQGKRVVCGPAVPLGIARGNLQRFEHRPGVPGLSRFGRTSRPARLSAPPPSQEAPPRSSPPYQRAAQHPPPAVPAFRA